LPLCMNNRDLTEALYSDLSYAPFIRAWVAPKDSRTYTKE
jgi:hypothetical protein